MTEKVEHLGDVYPDVEGGFMRVVGVIYNPAVILVNPVTGRKDVCVISSPNFRGMEKLSKDEALDICIARIKTVETKLCELTDKYCDLTVKRLDEIMTESIGT